MGCSWGGYKAFSHRRKVRKCCFGSHHVIFTMTGVSGWQYVLKCWRALTRVKHPSCGFRWHRAEKLSSGTGELDLKPRKDELTNTRSERPERSSGRGVGRWTTGLGPWPLHSPEPCWASSVWEQECASHIWSLCPTAHDRKRVSSAPSNHVNLGKLLIPSRTQLPYLQMGERRVTSDQVSVIDGVLWKPLVDKGVKGWERWGHVVCQLCSQLRLPPAEWLCYLRGLCDCAIGEVKSYKGLQG